MSESNLVVLPDMQAVENTEPEEIKAQEGIVSAASKKLDEEEKAFVGSGRAKMIFPHVVKTLRGFIEEDDRFAEVFANTVRTVSECCAAVVDHRSRRRVRHRERQHVPRALRGEHEPLL